MPGGTGCALPGEVVMPVRGGGDIHVGASESEHCNLRDWYVNQTECVTGKVIVDLMPQAGRGTVDFAAITARLA